MPGTCEERRELSTQGTGPEPGQLRANGRVSHDIAFCRSKEFSEFESQLTIHVVTNGVGLITFDANLGKLIFFLLRQDKAQAL